MAIVHKKQLGDLLINDIKTELEKRHLDKNGMKSVLIERLKKALVSEGKDPNTFHFDVIEASNNDDDDEQLGNDGDPTVNGKAVGNTPKTAQGKVCSVSQAGDIGGGAGGRGQDVGEENDDFDDEGNPGYDNEDLHSSTGNQSLQRTPSTAKPGTGFLKPTTPAKGKKNQSSTVREGGDDSFVLQEDDTVLNDIDADLLDGKAADSSSGPLGEAGDDKGDTNKSGQGNSATTDTSAKLAENTDTKDGSKTTGSKDDKDTKTVAKSSAKPGKDEKISESGRNLWVSGLSYRIRATDLKALFGKHGKVIAAKVVTNSRSPASRCFGLVTMSTANDATKCVQQLHRTELHGRMISVEKAKTETQGTKAKVLPPSGLRSPTKPSRRFASRKAAPVAKKEKEGEQPDESSKDKPELSEKEKKDVVSFSKIKADQEQERLRRKEMFLEREKYKQHMIEKRHREEAFRIDRERRRLREMREELERQHIETERMRLETERLHMEREQEKYRREQQRVMQARRALKRRGPREEEWPNKRPMAERFHGAERFEERPAQGEREHRTFREERPNREGRPVRDERNPRDGARGQARHDPRSEWKSEREVNRGTGGGSGAWNGPIDHSKMDDEWATGNMGQGDRWDSEVVLSQPNTGYPQQQGQMMTSGTGTVFIAQPSMQGASMMMQGNLSRQNEGRFGMAAASVRRF